MTGRKFQLTSTIFLDACDLLNIFLTTTATLRTLTKTTLLSTTKVLGTPPPPPNDRERALDTFLNAVKLDITTSTPNKSRDNLTITERQSISQLKQRQDIIIKPADKGSGTVVMDKTWYIDECLQILQTFERRHNC